MNDRDLMQQALDALTYKKWWCVGLGEPKDPKLEAAITSLNERLAHCDRCGKKMGGEGYIHTCSPPAAQRKPLTDEEIKALMPIADGTAETDKKRVEVLPGVMGYEFGEVDAWSMPLVLQIARAIEAAHGIKEKNNG